MYFQFLASQICVISHVLKSVSLFLRQNQRIIMTKMGLMFDFCSEKPDELKCHIFEINTALYMHPPVNFAPPEILPQIRPWLL